MQNKESKVVKRKNRGCTASKGLVFKARQRYLWYRTTYTVRQLRAVKKKKKPPKCKACSSSKHSCKDCPKRTGRGTTTSSYTPTDVKSDPEHILDEELTSSGCSGSDVPLDMWCLEDDDLMDIIQILKVRYGEVEKRESSRGATSKGVVFEARARYV